MPFDEILKLWRVFAKVVILADETCQLCAAEFLSPFRCNPRNIGQMCREDLPFLDRSFGQ